MRLGQNPAKFVEQVAQPEKLTVAIISYIPFLEGYYAHGMELLKTCLGSLWQNTSEPFDLMVFDNASCPEVRAYLQDAHEKRNIQYLVLSDRNIGKAGAWNFIFAAAPGETIAYADYDVYFHPGWLPAQMRVLEAFPLCGMLTGCPVRNAEKYSTSTVQWVQEHPEARLERGALMPWEDYWQHVQSLGYEEAEARQVYAEGEDVCLFDLGQKYYVGAGHFQFLAPRKVLQEVLPIPSRRPMGEVRLLDVAINERGYLRLSLPEFTVQHMGNILPGDIQAASLLKEAPRPQSGVVSWRPIRKFLLWLHKRTFNALYKG